MSGKRADAKASEIFPHQVIRYKDGPAFFGYGREQLAEKIKAGEIEAPFPLSETGRAMGWLGQQIIDHHAKLRELAAKRAEAAKAEAEVDEAIDKLLPRSRPKSKSKSPLRSKAEAR